MKHRVIIILMSVMIVCGCLCGCGKSNVNESKEKTQTTESNDYNAQPIEYNQVLSTEDAEIVFSNHSITSRVDVIREDGSTLSLENAEGDMYFLFMGSVKNLAADEIDFYDNFKAELVVDNKYNYPVVVDPYSLNGIVPLKTSGFSLYAQAPKEVLDSCETYSLYLGYMNGFQSVAAVKYCDNQYVINGKVDEYGSADNIQNFQMMTEYLDNVTKDTNLATTVKEQANTVEVLWMSSYIGEVNIGSTGTFDFCPKLAVRFSDIYKGMCAEFKMEVNEDSSHCHDHIYYVNVPKLTLSSSIGSYSIDSSSIDYFYDYNDTLLISDNSFYFDQEKIDYEKLRSIIEGDDAKFTVEIVQSTDEVHVEELPIDNDAREKLIGLLDFYNTLPLVK